MLQLKVCGMRDTANIAELIKVQVNFIGFIFHESSSRNIINVPNIEIPKNIKKVGVFVNKAESFIIDKINSFGLDFVQLHGTETPSFCAALKTNNVKIIKAFNVSDEFSFDDLKSYESFCDYFLFDAYGEKAGGNGVVFNWGLIKKYTGSVPFLLSGGIDETMVEKIKNFTHQKFIGIDINSGFEMEPALKNIEKIKHFLKNVQR